MRDSKFGQALVLTTLERAGGYILGFKIDTPGKLEELHKEISNLYDMFSASPLFGVKFTVEEQMPEISQLTKSRLEEDVDTVLDDGDAPSVACYYATGADAESDDIEKVTYDEILGLAIETIPNEVPLDQLWRVI